MELVRAHNTANIVTAACFVPLRYAGPEAGDLEHQLGAERVEELGITGGLVVLPNIVGDRRADMALKMRVVLDPIAGSRVKIHDVGFFSPITAALPRVHRAAESGLPGSPARLIEAPVAVK
jgi:hypothetical protein